MKNRPAPNIAPPTIEGAATEVFTLREKLRWFSGAFYRRFEKQIRIFKLLCIGCFLLEGFAAGIRVLKLALFMSNPPTTIVSTPMRVWTFAVAFATLIGGALVVTKLLRWWWERSEAYLDD